MSASCPSAAAGRYFDEQCEAAEAEAHFFRNNRDDILKAACAFAAREATPAEALERGAELVRLLNESGELE